MLLWRISNHVTLDGTGGLRASGRWHTRGRPVVYCATGPAAALLEVLVHLELDPAALPLRYRLMKIEVPDDLACERVAADDLPAGWAEHPAISRRRGDEWLARARSPLLEVPSALVPETCNVLINPRHPDTARIRILDSIEHPLDPRFAAPRAPG